jgi:hypothetical protein
MPWSYRGGHTLNLSLCHIRSQKPRLHALCKVWVRNEAHLDEGSKFRSFNNAVGIALYRGANNCDASTSSSRGEA